MSLHRHPIPRAPRPASVTLVSAAGALLALVAGALALTGYLQGGIGSWQLAPTPRPLSSAAWINAFRAGLLGAASVAVFYRQPLGRWVLLAVLIPDLVASPMQPGWDLPVVVLSLAAATWSLANRRASAFFDNMPAEDELDVTLLQSTRSQIHAQRHPALAVISVTLAAAVLAWTALLLVSGIRAGSLSRVLWVLLALAGLSAALTRMSIALWGGRTRAVTGAIATLAGGAVVLLGAAVAPPPRAMLVDWLLPSPALGAMGLESPTSFVNVAIAVPGLALLAIGALLLWIQAYSDRLKVSAQISSTRSGAQS